jgi:deazaflavin-dependent oxidoreductase (nitroreductase family)
MREWLRRAWFRLVAAGGASRLSLFLHPLLYRWTGGTGPLGRFLGNRIGILTTIGARSGKPRTVPIWIYPDGDAWVIVASRFGDQRAPGWYHNLRANPRATLQISRKRIEVDAREATGEEHERLWEMVNNAYPGYAHYRERSGRHIPVMVLTRAGTILSPASPAADASRASEGEQAASPSSPDACGGIRRGRRLSDPNELEPAAGATGSELGPI